jgi:hypothetical protein
LNGWQNLTQKQELEPFKTSDGAAMEAPTDAPADAAMADVLARVRERLRQDLLRHGASREFEDAALFSEVERVLHGAVDLGESKALLLPELLGDPQTWRLDTAMRWPSHRSAGPAWIVRVVKQRVLMPVLRWMFEYSRDNFERQRRVNQVLFACVQELAAETARLRRDLDRPRQ